MQFRGHLTLHQTVMYTKISGIMLFELKLYELKRLLGMHDYILEFETHLMHNNLALSKLPTDLYSRNKSFALVKKPIKNAYGNCHLHS
jgi:hypothetical protein